MSGFLSKSEESYSEDDGERRSLGVPLYLRRLEGQMFAVGPKGASIGAGRTLVHFSLSISNGKLSVLPYFGSVKLPSALPLLLVTALGFLYCINFNYFHQSAISIGCLTHCNIINFIICENSVAESSLTKQTILTQRPALSPQSNEK